MPKDNEKNKKAKGKWKRHEGIRMSDELFKTFADFVNSELGIKMPEKKHVMLESRLRKRLRALNITTFEEYHDLVFSDEGMQEEVFNFLDVVTTNKTDFFREPRHYGYLKEKVLPIVLKENGSRPLRIWSAGCSTGEEPYTLGIVLSEYGREKGKFDFNILASDVSTDVLCRAQEAIYREDRIDEVEESIKKRYFLRSKERNSKKVRVVKELRDLVTFKRVNFMHDDYEIEDTQDIVFFRNVMIYFDRPTQQAVINSICKHLRPGGFFFLGHSETLMGVKVPLESFMPTLYRRM
jgi:chemotaxis protein methyltransferase CheR